MGCDLLKFHYLCGRITNYDLLEEIKRYVVICSNFTTFAVESPISKSLRYGNEGCDLLKFHYLCGRITNPYKKVLKGARVVICSNFTTFAVESPIKPPFNLRVVGCDLLKFHYLCGRITNIVCVFT